ncbi:hypothetical protein Trydic_g9409 [Trypoxylus dichotomus]
MKRYFVYGSNLPENVDRRFLYKLFQQFGSIKKIYLHPELTWFKVYYDTLEEAEQAFTINEKPPHHLSLSIDSVAFTDKEKPFPNIDTPSVSESNTSTMSYEEEEEDIFGYTGPNHYNIHGICVPTLHGEDGRLYVALDEVKKVGFELFPENKIPRNIDFDRQMLNEFKIYLNIKAKKYITQMQCDIPDVRNIVEEVKNEITNEYMNSSGVHNSKPSNTNLPSLMDIKSSISNDQSKSSQGAGFNGQRNNRNPSNRNKPPHQSEYEKPLRRPTSSPINNELRSNSPANITKGRGNIKNGKTKNDNRGKKVNNSSINNGKENINPKVEVKVTANTETFNATETVQDVKRVDLPLNEPVQVIISFVESADKCWVFRESDKESLEELMFETNIEARKSRPIKPVVGQIYACTYLGTWYRVLVREVTPVVKVHYLDFGNFNEDEVKDIRELPSSIVSKPVLAVKVNFTTRPKNTLEDNGQLSIIATKKNEDGSYQVQEVSNENQQVEEVSNKSATENKRCPNVLNAIPAGVLNSPQQTKSVESKTKPIAPAKADVVNGIIPKPGTSHIQVETRKETTQNETDKLVEKVSNLSLKERLEKMKKKVSSSIPNSNRKCIADLFETSTNGTLEFIERLDDVSCTAFVLTDRFLEDIEKLDRIQGDKIITGKVGDIVSVRRDDAWVRGSVINAKNGKYDVAFLDYGKIISTNKVCALEKPFLDIPDFVCVCLGNSEFVNLFEKEIQADFVSNEKNKILVGFNDVFYDVSCGRWYPSLKAEPVEDPNHFPVILAPPVVKQVKDGERVLPVAINDGKLFVKTKETHMLTSKLNEQLASYTATPLSLPPVVNQLVLCPHETQHQLARGIVKTIENGYVDIDFIDLGFGDMVPISKLMNISESLAELCATTIPISLKGYAHGQFSDEEIEFLEGYCKREEKLLTKKCSSNIFELFSLNGNDRKSLSEKLKDLSAASSSNGESRIMSKTIPRWELKPGQTENLLCIGIEDDGEQIIFMPHNGVKDHIIDLNNKIIEYTDSNTEPYSPIVDELCIANYEGEWYRAKVQKVNRALEEYQVYYIDYGNIADVSSSDIRKMPVDFGKVPALAILGQLTELSNSDNKDEIIELIKQDIVVGNSYDVDVIRNIKENLYEISIALISAKIQESLDF